uniref:Uncharacterized protein n=1 Tax=Electric ant polycipivirus 1 TaxID=3003605 RepID=A0AA95J277_9VIRU|nr:hypothetical protein [Electric ant polycipivirus 1]
MQLTPQGVFRVGQQVTFLLFYLTQAFLVVSGLLAQIIIPILRSGTTLAVRRLVEALCFRAQRAPLLPLRHKKHDLSGSQEWLTLKISQ